MSVHRHGIGLSVVLISSVLKSLEETVAPTVARGT